MVCPHDEAAGLEEFNANVALRPRALEFPPPPTPPPNLPFPKIDNSRPITMTLGRNTNMNVAHIANFGLRGGWVEALEVVEIQARAAVAQQNFTMYATFM